MNRFARSGFTLIEIMIVVGIIAVLVTILTAVLLSASDKGDVATARNFVNNLVPKAMTDWQSNNGKSDNTFVRSPNMSGDDDYWQGNAELYQEFITDPAKGGTEPFILASQYTEGDRAGKKVFLDPWQRPYIYRNYSQKRSKSGRNKVFKGKRYNDNTYDIISLGVDGELGEVNGHNDDIYNGVQE